MRSNFLPSQVITYPETVTFDALSGRRETPNCGHKGCIVSIKEEFPVAILKLYKFRFNV